MKAAYRLCVCGIRGTLGLLKRRRFWVAVGCVLALMLVPLLMYRLWWYPNTPRGAVDRIRMGMKAAEVQAILEPLESGGKTWNDLPRSVEVWRLEKGEEVYTRSEKPGEVLGQYLALEPLALRKAVPLIGGESPGFEVGLSEARCCQGDDPINDVERPAPKFLNVATIADSQFLDKVTRDGIIFVLFDDQGRVFDKTWLEFPRESVNPLERFWSWLPF